MADSRGDDAVGRNCGISQGKRQIPKKGVGDSWSIPEQRRWEREVHWTEYGPDQGDRCGVAGLASFGPFGGEDFGSAGVSPPGI